MSDGKRHVKASETSGGITKWDVSIETPGSYQLGLECDDGKKLRFGFLALTRGEFISFYIQQADLSDEFLELKIKPKNWLVSMLVDPIYLQYQRSDRLLKEFRGVTNIRALSKGRVSEDNYQARIEYQYMVSYSNKRPFEIA